MNNYRKHLNQQGIARFSIVGLETDRELIRSLARRLAANDPDSARIRATVRQILEGNHTKKGGLLEALRRSPLVGANIFPDRAWAPQVRRLD